MFNSITTTLNLLKTKQVTVKEVIAECIKNHNPQQNIFITTLFEEAYAQAELAQQRYNTGTMRRLEGIPLGIKDLFCTKGIKTTAASQILADFVPNYESTVTSKLLDEGSIFMGKTNMDEFAMGSANINSGFGPCINPYTNDVQANGKNVEFVPGGSSGGSAACVAAGVTLAGIGSDTGGSVRLPAAWCGQVGIKPTYGTCSRYGMVAYASSLDQAGPITRNVEDGALLLDIMSGEDHRDATSFKRKYLDYKNIDATKLKVAVIKEMQFAYNPEVKAHYNRICELLAKHNIEIEEVSIPYLDLALQCYYVIAPAEASSNLARYDGIRYGQRKEGENLEELITNTRTAGFGAEVKRRILTGNYVLSAGHYDAFYGKAKKVQQTLKAHFKQVFAKVDVILSPTAPIPAFRLDSPPSVLEMYHMDVFTIPVNIANLCAVSVPVGFTGGGIHSASSAAAPALNQGLPIGMQLIGGSYCEHNTLSLAAFIEKHNV